MWNVFHRFASPPHFYRLAGGLGKWLGWSAALLIALSLYGGLVWAPPDYEMGDGFRIIYVHVPSAWMSLFTYTIMAVASAIGLIWRIKLAHAVAAATAVLGASFTFLALVTGSLWGKPMWGTWWVWDGRLTSELVLLFLFLGYIALRAAFDDTDRADRAGAVLAIVGIVNVPIIHYSVQWWATLHQGPTVTRLAAPAIDTRMLLPLLGMMLGFTLYYGALLTVRVRAEILERERHARWVSELLAEDPGEIKQG
jgi:heme exporter protein C